MLRMTAKIFCTFFLLFIGLSCSFSQVNKKIRLLFVFDASYSMKKMYVGKSRIEHAKIMLCKFIDSLSVNKNFEFALRMYGSAVAYPPGDCNDSKLIVPFGKNNVALIKEMVMAVKPTGITPIEHSLTMSAADFPDKNATNMILLITDGVEECGGDPCTAREKLFEKGIIFKPFIIGIGLTKLQAKTFDCVGQFFHAEEKNIVNKVTGIISKQSFNKTSIQVNLLDIGSKPTETNVNMIFYDQKNGKVNGNFVHALNEKGNPDTLLLSDYYTYKIIVNTIPSIEKKDVKIISGKHNIIAIDAPQGIISLHWSAQKNFQTKPDQKIKAVVCKSGNSNTIHVQNISTKEKYILGSYDLEIMTLPHTIITNIKVNQSIEKIIEIPLPGIVSINLPQIGTAQILKEENGKLSFVVNLDKNKTSHSLKLQPGNYRIEYRDFTQKLTIFSIERNFKVESEKEYFIDLKAL